METVLNDFMNGGLMGMGSKIQKSGLDDNSEVALYALIIVLLVLPYLVISYMAIGKVISGSSQKCTYWRLFFYVLLTINIFYLPVIPVGFIFILMWLARVKLCN